MFGHFYNESLRKLTVGFGTLFDEVYVVRSNSDGTENNKLQVPITYSSKEKFIRRLQEQSGISDSTKVEITLPRMSFELGSIDYDPTRHLNKINTRVRRVDGENPYTSYQEVPYNVSFSLYLYSRSMDDNLQMIEQIVPYFAPEFIVTLKLNNIEQTLDVPIVLSNVAIQEQYEGNFLDRRVIASSLNFVCKTRLYSPIKQGPPIIGSDINFGSISGDGTTGDIAATAGASGDIADYTEGGFGYD